jgi:hypothetical protein
LRWHSDVGDPIYLSALIWQIWSIWMALFSQDQLEAIAGALGDTSAGLTGSEI